MRSIDFILILSHASYNDVVPLFSFSFLFFFFDNSIIEVGMILILDASVGNTSRCQLSYKTLGMHIVLSYVEHNFVPDPVRTGPNVGSTPILNRFFL